MCLNRSRGCSIDTSASAAQSEGRTGGTKKTRTRASSRIPDFWLTRTLLRRSFESSGPKVDQFRMNNRIDDCGRHPVAESVGEVDDSPCWTNRDSTGTD